MAIQFSRFRFADESAGIRGNNAVPGNKLSEVGGLLAYIEWKINFPDSMSHLEVAWKCQNDEFLRTLRASREHCFY